MNIAKTGSDSIQVHWRIEEWFPDLDKNLVAKLRQFHEELLKANRTVPLIGVKTIPVADAVHFADSIIASKAAMAALPKMTTLHEFGSGNGFPGIIFAAMHPNVKVIIVDGDKRKCEFIQHVATTLGLKNIQVLSGQVGAIPENSVDFAISRGFAPIAKAILVTRKSFKIGGTYLHMKGEEWVTEIANIPTQLCSIWTPSLITEYSLPVGEVKFALVKTEKIGN